MQNVNTSSKNEKNYFHVVERPRKPRNSKSFRKSKIFFFFLEGFKVLKRHAFFTKTENH